VVGTLRANERSGHLIPAQGFEKVAATTTSSLGINFMCTASGRSPTHSGDTLFQKFCFSVQIKNPFWRACTKLSVQKFSALDIVGTYPDLFSHFQ
jgi:hypothetical protein